MLWPAVMVVTGDGCREVTVVSGGESIDKSDGNSEWQWM